MEEAPLLFIALLSVPAIFAALGLPLVGIVLGRRDREASRAVTKAP